MRGKGYNGETCAEAIKSMMLKLGTPTSALDIFKEVNTLGSWSDDNIWQCLMEFVVNLPPSYKHYPGTDLSKRFIIVREDGKYELYRQDTHGKYSDGEKV